jgi:biopolymer transport protein ExbD
MLIMTLPVQTYGVKVEQPRSVTPTTPATTIYIDIHPDYDVVANVMASAQRNNMTRIGFSNVAQFAD